MDYKDFASKIKTKYPQYKDLDDKVLSEKMIAKYPQYKDQVKLEKSFIQKYKDEETALQTGINRTSAFLTKGVSDAVGGVLGLGGKLIGGISKGVGVVGDTYYGSLGKITSLFNKDAGKMFDTIGQDFKKNQFDFAQNVNQASLDTTKYFSEGGTEAKEILLKKDEAYQKNKLNKTNDFKFKDLTDKDFLTFDLYSGLLENAPTMVASFYVGNKLGTLNTASKALKFLSQVGGSTLFSTGVNAVRESDSAYQNALDQGLSKEEAGVQAERVFRRNSTGNLGLEALQMLALFSPATKVASPFLKYLMTTGKITGAGAVEALQERGEDAIQNQAGDEDFKVQKFFSDITKKGLTKSDAISFILGAGFQGVGNAFVNEETVEKAVKEQIESIADRLPPDGAGGSAQDKVERAIEKDPSKVEEIIKQVQSEIKETPKKIQERSVADKLTGQVEQSLAEGKTPTQVTYEISQKVGVDEARRIVQEAVTRETPQVTQTTAVKDTTSNLKAIEDKTPAQVQEDFNKEQSVSDKEISKIREDIRQLKNKIESAQNGSVLKKNLKTDLSVLQDKLNEAEQGFQDTATTQAEGVRTYLNEYLKKNFDTKFSKNDQEQLLDRIVDQINNPNETTGILPISRIVKAQVARFKPTVKRKIKADVVAEFDKTEVKEEDKKSVETKTKKKISKEVVEQADTESASDILERYKKSHANYSENGIRNWIDSGNANQELADAVVKLFTQQNGKEVMDSMLKKQEEKNARKKENIRKKTDKMIGRKEKTKESALQGIEMTEAEVEVLSNIVKGMTQPEVIGNVPIEVKTGENGDTPNAKAPMGGKESSITIGNERETTIKGISVNKENTKVSYKTIDTLGNGRQPISSVKKVLKQAGVSEKDIRSIIARIPTIDGGQTFTDNVFDAITDHNDAVKEQTTKTSTQKQEDFYKKEEAKQPTKDKTTEEVSIDDKQKYTFENLEKGAPEDLKGDSLIVNGEIVGGIEYNGGIDSDMVIDLIEIKPQFRKKGYAKKVINNLLKQSATNKITGIATPDSVSFWKSVGANVSDKLIDGGYDFSISKQEEKKVEIITAKKSKRIGLADYSPTYTENMNRLIKEAQENGDTFPYLKMSKEEQKLVDDVLSGVVTDVKKEYEKGQKKDETQEAESVPNQTTIQDLLAKTKTEARKSLTLGHVIADPQEKLVQKISEANKGFYMGVYTMRPTYYVDFAEQKVITDTFVLINDAKVFQKISEKITKKYPNILNEKKSENAIDWKMLATGTQTKAIVQGHVVTKLPYSNTNLTATILSNGVYQQAVDTNKFAFLRNEFPNADLFFTGNMNPIVLSQKGKIKALIMPIQGVPKESTFPVAIESKPSKTAKQTKKFVQEEETKAKSKAKPEEKLEDVGEKIGGARKDLFAKQQEKFAQSFDDNEIATLSMAEALPPIDYKNLLENGVSEDMIASYVYLRTLIGRKPKRSYQIRSWVSQVQALRTVAKALFEKGNVSEEIMARFIKMGDKQLQFYKELDFIENKAVQQYSIATRERGENTLYLLRKTGGARSSVFSEDFSTFMEKAKEHILKERKEGTKKSIEDSFSVFIRAGEYLTAYKKGSRFIEFEVFKSLEEAKLAVRDPQKIKEYVEKYQEIVNFDENTFRNSTNELPARTYRKGDISTQEFADTFGFRGVEFGNWVNQSERQERLNYAFDSFKDLAKILDIPDKSISLNGELAFAFGSRGKAGASAHYEPDKIVINLTKKDGAGTIAHEWWHALDHYLSRRTGQKLKYLTESLKYERKEVETSFYDLMIGIAKLDLYKRSKGADTAKGAKYYMNKTELGARAFESYIQQKLKDQDLKNTYLVNLKEYEALAPENQAIFPYAKKEEIPVIVEKMDAIFDALMVEESPKQALFSLKDDIGVTNAQQVKLSQFTSAIKDMTAGNLSDQERIATMFDEIKSFLTTQQFEIFKTFVRYEAKESSPTNNQVKDRIDFLQDIKDRFKIDFDVHFVNHILAGVDYSKSGQKSLVEAYGAMLDNSIVLAKDVFEDTKRHEVVHLTLANAKNIPILAKNGISRRSVLSAQAQAMGKDYDALTIEQKIEIEEVVAQNFENWVSPSSTYQATGIIRKFFVLLKKLIFGAKRVVNSLPEQVLEFYELLENGRDINAKVSFLENKGDITAFIQDGNLDLRQSDYAVNFNEPARRLTVTKLKKVDWNDKRLGNLVVEHNKAVDLQEKLEQDTKAWKDDLDQYVDKKISLLDYVQASETQTKELSKRTTRKDPRTLTERGEELAREFGFESMEEAQSEVSAYLERLTELNETKRKLRIIRKSISEAQKMKKTNVRALRDVERKLKSRKRFLQKKKYYVDMGVRRGKLIQKRAMNAKLASDRQRQRKIDRLKQIYKRTKQATQTGAYLPIDYQKQLVEIFNNYDFTRMTEKTKKSLEATQKFFEQKGDDVSVNIAKKLERLSKTAIKDMTDLEIEALVETIEHIYNLGVTKRKLERGRDEREKGKLLSKVLETTINIDTQKGLLKDSALKLGIKESSIERITEVNMKTLESFRVADMIDGYKNYEGANYTELQRPIAEAVAEANEQSDTLIFEALQDINEFGNSFSTDEQARMVYYSALAQGGQAQALALKKKYKDINFDAPLTEKEAGALAVMKDTFKEVRPEVASTYESIKNIPFPDNPEYFPFKYDSSATVFDIQENAFDFSVTKTKQGFTVTREQQVDKVLDIEIFKVFARSIGEQVYYAKVQPALDTTKEIVNSREYQKQSGVLANRFWKTFIEDVSRKGSTGGIMDTLRSNISVATLGYKLSTILIQPLALVDAMSTMKQEFGYKKALSLLPKLVHMGISPSAMRAVRESSLALRERKGGQVESSEIQALTESRLSDKVYKRWYSTFSRNAFKAMQYVDMMSASAVVSEFRDAYIEQGMSFEDATTRAETMMKLTQASTNVADRPHVMNTSTGRFVLTFQTFVLNAFNNVRHDLIKSNIRNKGALKGAFYAISALQFIVYARVLEEMLRDQMFSLIYGGEDDDESFLQGVWKMFIGNIPFFNNLVDWDGNVSREGMRNPVIDTLLKGGQSIDKLIKGNGTGSDILTSLVSAFSLGGIAGTSQVNQLIRSNFNPFRQEMGINDFKTNAERSAQEIEKFVSKGTQISNTSIEELTGEIYGDDYKDGDLAYKKGKKAEVMTELAVRKKYGFDNVVVNGFIDAKNNGEKKVIIIDYAKANGNDSAKKIVSDLKKPVVVLGDKYSFVSDQLGKELKNVIEASEEEKELISQMVSLETDAERIEILNGLPESKRKKIAEDLYKDYKVISKELYETYK